MPERHNALSSTPATPAATPLVSGSAPQHRRRQGRGRGGAHLSRGLAATFTLVVLLAASVPPAAAHDGLVDSQPASGSVVAQAPSQAVLTFSADVQQIGTTIELQDTAGTTLSDQAAVVDGRDVVLTLPTQLDPGELQLVYRVTSSDGHPISGAVPFTLERAAATRSPEQTPQPTPEPTSSRPAQPPSTFPSVTTSPSAPQAAPAIPQAGPTTGSQAATAEASEDAAGRGTAWLLWGSVALALLAAAVVAVVLRRKQTP